MEKHSKNIKNKKYCYLLKNLKQIQIPNFIKIKILSNQNCRLRRKVIIEEISNTTNSHDSPNQSIINNNISTQNNIMISNRIQNINNFSSPHEIQKHDIINSLSAECYNIDKKNKFNYSNKFLTPLKKSQNFDNIKVKMENKLLDEVINKANKTQGKSNKMILPKIKLNRKKLYKNKISKNLISKKINKDKKVDENKDDKKIENKMNENNFYEPIKINYIYRKVKNKNKNKENDVKDRENIKLYDSNNYEVVKDINSNIFSLP